MLNDLLRQVKILEHFIKFLENAFNSGEKYVVSKKIIKFAT
jgi:hypothetical protein